MFLPLFTALQLPWFQKYCKQAGYKNVTIVKEQALPDGDFPTVESPNPEEPEALKMAIDLAIKQNADIVVVQILIVTD